MASPSQRHLAQDLAQLDVPRRIELHQGALFYQTRRTTTTFASRALLTEFLALPDVPDERVLEFARKWGVLEICKEHGWPVEHATRCAVTWVHSAKSRPKMPEAYKARVENFRQWARRFKCLVDTAAALKGGRSVEGLDITFMFALRAAPRASTQVLVGPRLGAAIRSGSIAKDETRNAEWFPDVTGSINRWMELSGVGPRLVVEQGRLSVVLAKPSFSGIPPFSLSLFGALTIQALHHVLSLDEIPYCDACGKPFSRPGTPRKGLRNRFCSDCGLLAAKRLAQRKYYRSDKAKKRRELAKRQRALVEKERHAKQTPRKR